MKTKYYHAYVLIGTAFFLLLASCTEETPGEDFSKGNREGIVHYRQLESVPGMADHLASQQHNAITEAYYDTRNAIVAIAFLEEKDYNLETGIEITPIATGFFISEEGHIISWIPFETSAPDSMMVLIGDQRIHAEVKATDPNSGITMLKADEETAFSFLHFCRESSGRPGDTVLSLIKLLRNHHSFASPVLSSGIISSTEHVLEINSHPAFVYPDLLMIDKQPGAHIAGAPLIYPDGRLAGMSIFFPDSLIPPHYKNYSFAIPAKKIARMANYFAEGKQNKLDYSIGLEMVPVTLSIAERYYLPVNHGLFVVGVNRDGPAYDGGILPGDIITKIGDEIIYGELHTRAVLHDYKRGDRMAVSIIRGGKPREAEFVLRKRLIEE